MKKFCFIVCISFLFSCSKSEPSVKPELEKDSPIVEEVKDPIVKGESLVANSDCFGCHKVDSKLVGPSFKEIAAKYKETPNNVAILAGKIIHGSSGIWGDIPMQPHHGLSEENAKFMAQYILSIK